MPQRHILFVDSARLQAFRTGNGTVQLEGRFSAEPEGLESFGAYLHEHRHGIFTLLADVPEEGFQTEDIPNVGGKDRDALIKRKLGQYFYGTQFALAESQGRQKSGRRDERLLLMALTRPQQFDPWLEALQAHHIALAGMYALPQLTVGLLPKDVTHPVLLITQTHSGLRQTFFAERQLRFSRLTTLATGSAEESAIAAALEAGKMHQYLVSQRLIERNKPLATRVLTHPAQMQAMRSRCQDTAELHFEFIDLQQEATRTGLRSPLADSRAETLFSHLLAKSPPRSQFAPAPARSHYRLWQTRFALRGASFIILAGGLLFAAKQGLGLMNVRDETARIIAESQLNERRYAEAMQSLPKVALTTDNLRALVGRYDQIDKRAVGPMPLLVQLSQSLDAFPAITLDQIEWLSSDEIAPAAAGGSGPKDAPPPPPQMAGGPYSHAVVAAKLPLGMVGDQRGQLKLVADFVQHLGATPNTLVTVLTQPVDTQSGKTLRSGDDNRVSEAPRFVFRLTRKL